MGSLQPIIEPQSSAVHPGMLFRSEEARQILKNKHVVVIGDSVQRNVYQDLVLFLQNDRFLRPDKTEMKGKFQDSLNGDRLLFRTEITNSRDVREMREFQSADGYYLIQYYFVTKCWNNWMKEIIGCFLKQEMPDVIIMNSCLWDTTRYGPESEADFRRNLALLASELRRVLPRTSSFIWTTSLPIASHITVPSIVPRDLPLDIRTETEEKLRTSILVNNYFAAQIISQHGFDVLDLHYYVRQLLSYRDQDGVHWSPVIHRHMSDLILSFLSDAFGFKLPPRIIGKLKSTDCDTSTTGWRNNRNFTDYSYHPKFSRCSSDETGPLADELNINNSDT